MGGSWVSEDSTGCGALSRQFGLSEISSSSSGLQLTKLPAPPAAPRSQ